MGRKTKTVSPPTVTENDSTPYKVFKLGSFLRINYKFFATSERSSIWMYEKDKGIWNPEGLNYIQRFLADYLGSMYRKHLVSEIQSYVRYSSYDPDIEMGGPPHKNVMVNGVYNLDTDELEDFEPDDYQIAGIPIRYDPEADCPAIKKFMKEVLKKEGDELKTEQDIKAIEEFFGYCLLKDYPNALVIMLLGEGANGKSTLLEVLRCFLGHENIMGCSPQQLEQDKFKMAQLHGKLADIAGDIPAKPLESTGIIKMLTGGDIITCEHKFQGPFSFVNFAKLIFSANQLPKSYDPSDAFHRRFRLIDFPNKFPAGDPNTIPKDKLIASLTTPEELSGLFNLAIKGLARLREQGQFTGEKTVEDKRLSFVKRSDPVEYFALKFIYHDPMSPPIEKTVLYDLYVDLCHYLGMKPTNNAWFAKQLRRTVPFIASKQVRGPQGDKIWAWTGIGIWFDDLMNELGKNELDLQHRLVGEEVEDTIVGQPTKSLDEVFDDPSLREAFEVDEDDNKSDENG